MRTAFKLILVPLFSGSLLAGPVITTDPNTGAVTWRQDQDGVSFSLTQLLPEQLLAFYVNRGFSIEQIEDFAHACVFMTVLRNHRSEGTIHFNRQRWQVTSNGQSVNIISTDQWLKRLNEQPVSGSSLLAFKWAQFPSEQEYEPGGDWNQGMQAIGLPPGSEFNIRVIWDIDKRDYFNQLNGVHCAE